MPNANAEIGGPIPGGNGEQKVETTAVLLQRGSIWRLQPPPRLFWSGRRHTVTAPLSRRLVLPVAIQTWSLTSLQQRLFKTGGRLIRHARYFTLQLAESYLTRPLFRQIVARIERLAWHPT